MFKEKHRTEMFKMTHKAETRGRNMEESNNWDTYLIITNTYSLNTITVCSGRRLE